MIYAVSDLHGYPLEKFLGILQQINFSKDDFLYVLGDVIDRGKDGIALLKWMMRQPNVQLILGNHEAMMLSCEFLFDEITNASIMGLTGTKLKLASVWLNNSAGPTITALQATRQVEIEYILEYLREAPLYQTVAVQGKDYLLCHSGPDHFSPQKPLSEYTLHDFVWSRPTLDSRYFEDALVVFGHTPTVKFGEEYKGRAVKTDTWVDIDVGAGLGLTPMIFRLDDQQEFYFDV